MRVADFMAAIEAVAPLSYQESYDNAGLIVGSPTDTVTGVLIALDVTEAVITEALSKNCNMIVTHHPIIFKGLKHLTGSTHVERTVLTAIRQGIALYAAHTNLDNQLIQGVNTKICEKLGVLQPKILQPKEDTIRKLVTYVPVTHADALREALFEAGGGVIGDYDQCSFAALGVGTFRGGEGTQLFSGVPHQRQYDAEMRLEITFATHLQSRVLSALLATHPYEEVAYEILPLLNRHPRIGAGVVGNLERPMKTTAFLKLVKKEMNATVVRHTRPIHEQVHRIAICGGSGSSLLQAAIKARADVFISSDFKYHEFFETNDQIMVADIGHFESEQFTSELLRDVIAAKFPTFAVYLAETPTNPVHYL
jgi:dinuclear metal center YbgI/SA1388 family protein